MAINLCWFQLAVCLDAGGENQSSLSLRLLEPARQAIEVYVSLYSALPGYRLLT
jgi:hypothetical protein